MAILAEELVEEWLNRHGYFTIRGVKVGVDEIDLLAMRYFGSKLVCRHVEVQASVRPMGYIAPRTKAMCAQGVDRLSAKRRSIEEIHEAVRGWIERKYSNPNKQAVMASLGNGEWSRELVLHIAKYPDEVAAIESEGIKIHRLNDIIDELLGEPPLGIRAGRSDLVDLLVRPARRDTPSSP